MPKEVQTVSDANNILTEKLKIVNAECMLNSGEYRRLKKQTFLKLKIYLKNYPKKNIIFLNLMLIS